MLHQLDFETGGTGAFCRDAFAPALSRLLQSIIAFIFEVLGVPSYFRPLSGDLSMIGAVVVSESESKRGI